jgi:hypothetical protein
MIPFFGVGRCAHALWVPPGTATVNSGPERPSSLGLRTVDREGAVCRQSDSPDVRRVTASRVVSEEPGGVRRVPESTDPSTGKGVICGGRTPKVRRFEAR